MLVLCFSIISFDLSESGCVPIDIQHLEKLDMTEKFGGALLSFACEDDYNLIGIKEIYCDSKVWSAPPPVCKGI